MNKNTSRKFRLAARWQSFGFAIRGFGKLLASEHNARIHASVTIAVMIAGVLLGVSKDDWCWLMLATGLVWISEAFNTSLEYLADAISIEFHPAIRDAKDVAASAVLIASVLAVGIGITRLAPHLVSVVF